MIDGVNRRGMCGVSKTPTHIMIWFTVHNMLYESKEGVMEKCIVQWKVTSRAMESFA